MFGAYNSAPAENNEGWGVDPSMYTTTLDVNQLTAEQLRRADEIAKQILDERAGRHVPHETHPAPAPALPRAMAPDVMQISSAEEAMRLLGQRKGGGRGGNAQPQRQPMRAPNQPQPISRAPQRRAMGGRAPQRQPAPIGRQQQRQPIGQPRRPQRVGGPIGRPGNSSAPIGSRAPAPAPLAANIRRGEEAAYAHLKKELLRIRMLLKNFGEPNNAQKGQFLRSLTKGLVACLKQPPPDVRATIGDYFRRTGWEIRLNKAVPGASPPAGEHMETLLRFSVTFFGKRVGKPTATEIIAASQPVAQRVQRQQPRGQYNQPQRHHRPQHQPSKPRGNNRQQNQRQWKHQQQHRGGRNQNNHTLNQPRRR